MKSVWMSAGFALALFGHSDPLSAQVTQFRKASVDTVAGRMLTSKNGSTYKFFQNGNFELYNYRETITKGSWEIGAGGNFITTRYLRQTIFNGTTYNRKLSKNYVICERSGNLYLAKSNAFAGCFGTRIVSVGRI